MRLSTRLLYFGTLLCLFPALHATEIRGLGDKCLDAAGKNSENGTHLILWECTGHENQQWYFTENGELRGIGGKCVSIAGKNPKNGTQLILWECDGNQNQRWQLTGDGQIENMNGRCLDMTGNSSENGTKITLWKCHDKGNQRWRALSSDNNWHSATGNQREKKRWYHDENANNYQGQGATSDDSRHDRGNFNRPKDNTNRADKGSANRSDSEYYYTQKDRNRWEKPSVVDEEKCQNLYTVQNKCYAVGATAENVPAKRLKACNRAVDRSEQELAESTDFAHSVLYSETIRNVCAAACENGIGGKGSPAYIDFQQVCRENGL